MQVLVIAVLSAALIMAVVLLVMSKRRSGSVCDADAVINNIMTRTSIRTFTNESLTDSQIETLLKAGMAAPSARNKQPWKFVVVKSRPLLRQIADLLPNTRLTSAACAIIVCGDMTKLSMALTAIFGFTTVRPRPRTFFWPPTHWALVRCGPEFSPIPTELTNCAA